MPQLFEYLKVSQATGLEFQYLKVSQATGLESQAMELVFQATGLELHWCLKLRGWNLCISRYLKVQGRYLKLRSYGDGISSYGAGISSYVLKFEYLKVPQLFEYLKVSQATGLEFQYLKVSQATGLESQAMELVFQATGLELHWCLKLRGWNLSISRYLKVRARYLKLRSYGDGI